MALLYALPEIPQEPDRQLVAIPDGPAGVAATLDAMVQFARQYRIDPVIHRLASDIVAAIPSKSYLAEAQAVQDWVKNHVRYTQDVYDVETVQTPLYTLQRMQGDCDDHALLAGTLLQALGHPVRFKAVAFSAPDQFEHVFAETKIGPRWVALETTEAAPLGWLPATALPPMIRNV